MDGQVAPPTSGHMPASALAAVLSCVSTPVFLLRSDGLIIQQNVAATDLLTGQKLSKLHARLVGRRSGETDRLADVITRVAEGQNSDVFCFFGRNGTIRLILTIAAVTGADLLTVCIADLESTAGGLADFLQKTFALTPQCAELAQSLMHGRSLAEFARDTGVTIKTARSRLDRLLARTGKKSPTALVSALWRTAAIATIS